nr:MAG TPA: hypothetical protein [Caudoviricetes sp.]
MCCLNRQYTGAIPLTPEGEIIPLTPEGERVVSC